MKTTSLLTLLVLTALHALAAGPPTAKPIWFKRMLNHNLNPNKREAKTATIKLQPVSSDLLGYIGQAYDSLSHYYYFYDSRDSLIKTINHSMDRNNDTVELIITGYNAKGRKNEETHQIMLHDSILHYINRTRNTYDSADRQVLYTEEYWTGSAWQVTYGHSRDLTYDTHGHIVQVIEKVADTAGIWHNDFRADWNWDNSDNLISGTEYVGNDTGWTLQNRLIDISHSEDIFHILKATAQENNNGTWTDANRITCTYNAARNPLNILIEMYDGSKWANEEKMSYKYNKYGTLYLYEDDVWMNGWSVTDGNADSLTYDNDGNLLMDENIYFDQSQDQWQKFTKVVYHYDKSSIKSTYQPDEVKLYPVPVHDMMHLTMSDHNGSDIYILIFDMTGRKVYESTKTASSDIFIPVSGLNNGIYSLNIVSGNRAISRSFIKN